jgi:hypothetical protein
MTGVCRRMAHVAAAHRDYDGVGQYGADLDNVGRSN